MDRVIRSPKQRVPVAPQNGPRSEKALKKRMKYGMLGARHSLWDPILSFLHTFSPKSTHVGGPRPPNGCTPPYGKSWIRHWYPPRKYTSGIVLLRANGAKTYLGILWRGRGYRKSGITDFVNFFRFF